MENIQGQKPDRAGSEERLEKLFEVLYANKEYGHEYLNNPDQLSKDLEKFYEAFHGSKINAYEIPENKGRVVKKRDLERLTHFKASKIEFLMCVMHVMSEKKNTTEASSP
jgi:hypothetical protein